MTINVKKPKGMAGRKRSASAAARVLATRKKAAAPESVRRIARQVGCPVSDSKDGRSLRVRKMA
jgi:hypothetical protein